MTQTAQEFPVVEDIDPPSKARPSPTDQQAPRSEASTGSAAEGAPIVFDINGRPAVQLPGDGRPLGEFAAEIGGLLAPHHIFARQGLPFTLDPEGQQLQPATATWLRTWAEEHLCCYKLRVTARNSMTLAATMTEDAARAVLASPQFLGRLRRVERFHPCRMPVVRSNGAIELLPVGHDQESSTFTAAGAGYSLSMSLDEARATLDQALAEFPFPDDSGRSKAVAVAALLTVFAAGVMPAGSNRPVFLYMANSEGSGKTTLARLACVPYGTIGVESAPTDEAEWQKKLLSAVIGGRRVLLLDNLKGYLASPALEAYTTSSRYSGRILGVSKEFSGEAGATVLVTGNRLTISPDMRRRSLTVELFMQELRAEDRKFARRLDDPALLELRPRLLAAAWAIVREWDKGGRLGASRENSSFPRWGDTIGGMVEFAGFSCPTAPADLDGMGDTDTADITKMANQIECDEPKTFHEICDLCADHGLFDRYVTDRDHDGDLTRAAKRGFSNLLKRYDRRAIGRGVSLSIEGSGHSKRYVLRRLQ